MVSSARHGIWLRHKSNEKRGEGCSARYTTYEISFCRNLAVAFARNFFFFSAVSLLYHQRYIFCSLRIARARHNSSTLRRRLVNVTFSWIWSRRSRTFYVFSPFLSFVEFLFGIRNFNFRSYPYRHQFCFQSSKARCNRPSNFKLKWNWNEIIWMYIDLYFCEQFKGWNRWYYKVFA